MNGSVNFVFGLWDAPAAGSRIGAPVTLNSIAVSNGLFTVELDFGTNRFAGGARWLDIAANGTSLEPRQAINPVPMALYALTPAGPADFGDVVFNTAAGRVLTATSGGNVGIGTRGGTNKLEVAGDTRIHGQLNLNGVISGDTATMAVRARAEDPASFVCSDARGLPVFRVNVALPSYSISMFADLYVQAHAYKLQGGTSWEAFSDRRLKQGVRPYEPGLNEILRLRPVRFRYRDDAERGLTSDHEEVGFIAQEIREVIPDAVTEGKDGYLSLKADPIHWAALNAIQQLNTNLEAAVKEKDARITALEQSVAELKELVSALGQAKGGAR